MRLAIMGIVLLLAILAGAIFVGYYGWVSAGDVVMPAWGWLMMGLGIFFTLLVGGGLMALVFYSSRAGFDEPPEVEPNSLPRDGSSDHARRSPRGHRKVKSHSQRGVL